MDEAFLVAKHFFRRPSENGFCRGRYVAEFEVLADLQNKIAAVFRQCLEVHRRRVAFGRGSAEKLSEELFHFHIQLIFTSRQHTAVYDALKIAPRPEDVPLCLGAQLQDDRTAALAAEIAALSVGT